MQTTSFQRDATQARSSSRAALVSPSVRVGLEPLKMLQADSLAFIERPASAFARLEKRIAKVIDRELADGGPEEFVRRMLKPVASMTAAQCAEAPVRMRDDIEQRRRRVARSPMGLELLALIETAHSRVRNGPLLAGLHPGDHGKAGLRAQSRIARIAGTRGEARAELTLDAIAVVWEEVYQPYLQSLWKLSRVRHGIAPGSPPRGSNLMKELSAALGADSALVEPDGLRIRDAVAHRHIEHMSRGVVTLRNKDGWVARYEQIDLETVMKRMMTASTDAFVEAMNAFVMLAVMEPMLLVMPEFARAVVANDPEEIERTGAIMQARQGEIWTDVARLYQRSSRAAT